MKIKIGIVGYGNIGKGVEKEIKKHDNMELVGIFTRRDVEEIVSDNNVYSIKDIDKFKDKIDVMVLCLGSAVDLPKYTHKIAKNFNTVDSFDTHRKISDYYKRINKINRRSNTVSVISVGWDPGIFSLARLMFESILLSSKTYTFWGSGVSQGHSEAIRKIDGVKQAIQYTHPKKDAIDKVKEGFTDNIKEKDKHTRECFVVLENDNEKNRKEIENKIKNIKNYFLGYETIVNYITEEEFMNSHTQMKHGGVVICNGITGDNNKHTTELSLKLDSNPEFSASVMLAYAKAVYKLKDEKRYGAYTTFDIPLSYISNKSSISLLKDIL